MQQAAARGCAHAKEEEEMFVILFHMPTHRRDNLAHATVVMSNNLLRSHVCACDQWVS